MIRLLIVEDDRELLEDVVGMFRTLPDITIAASYMTIAEALTAPSFDVALVDLHLPDGSGLTLLRELDTRHPDATLIAFTKFDDDDSVFGALEAGASGYVLKSDPMDRLATVVRDAAQGGAPMTARIARRVLESFHRSDEGTPLTGRELDVLRGLVAGHTYNQIADSAGIALSTVQTHIKNLYRKLHVRSKAAAARIAIERKLVRP